MAAIWPHRSTPIKVFQVFCQGFHIRFQTSVRHSVVSKTGNSPGGSFTKMGAKKELSNSAFPQFSLIKLPFKSFKSATVVFLFCFVSHIASKTFRISLNILYDTLFKFLFYLFSYFRTLVSHLAIMQIVCPFLCVNIFISCFRFHLMLDGHSVFIHFCFFLIFLI